MSTTGISQRYLDTAKRLRGGRLHAYESYDPARTALVVIDMQENFLNEGFPGYVAEGVELIPTINGLTANLRGLGSKVVWVKTVSPEGDDDWANRRDATSAENWKRRQESLAPGGPGFDLHADLEVDEADRVIYKTRYSALLPHPSDLYHYLVENDIESVLIAGVATSTCCESTAREASMWGWRTVMLSDCTADATPEQHLNTLGKILTLFGDVRSSQEMIELLSADRE